MIRRLLIGTLVVAATLIALISLALVYVWRNPSPQLPLNESTLRFFLDAYEAVGVAFLVALLAAVIPHLLPEARDRFERFKDSRRAYSRAKTSVIYLPETLSSLAFVEAVTAVQNAHEKLHLAETYPDELRQHLHWHANPQTWVDRNYWDLFALRRVLDLNVDSWSAMTTAARLQSLWHALKVVEEVFGEDNNNNRWARLPSEARESAIEAALNSKVGRIAARPDVHAA